jgi:arylsulfatase A-like enzyme
MADCPNILLVVADGMQGRTVAPEHACRTPHLERLMERGTRIGNAYTPLPTCSPARASLMTGLLPHNHGVLEVEHAVDPDQSVLRTDRPHWAQHLRQAGYATAYFGKWHIERSGELEKYGWDTHDIHGAAAHRTASQRGGSGDGVPLDPSTVRTYSGPQGYNDTLQYGVTDLPPQERQIGRPAALAAKYLQEASGDRPWCCCVSYYEPNEALVVGREAYNQYDVESLPLPANLRDELIDRPGIYRRSKQVWDGVSDEVWRQALACYYGRITEIDAQVGLLLDVLEKTGQTEDTLVIFTADHGRYMGAHGMDAHNFGAFEEIYHVPMIVAGPSVAAGAFTDARVGFHDLCPTLCELAAVEAPQVPDSCSFAPLLADPSGCEDTYRQGYAEYHGTRFRTTQRVYWEGAWKYIFNGFDYDELYNLADDPHELKNLAAEPQCADKARHLMAQIWRRAAQTQDHTLVNTHYPSMRFGVVGPEVGDL